MNPNKKLKVAKRDSAVQREGAEAVLGVQCTHTSLSLAWVRKPETFKLIKKPPSSTCASLFYSIQPGRFQSQFWTNDTVTTWVLAEEHTQNDMKHYDFGNIHVHFSYFLSWMTVDSFFFPHTLTHPGSSPETRTSKKTTNDITLLECWTLNCEFDQLLPI